MREGVDHFTAALEAPTLLDAQALEASGQDRIDAGIAFLDVLTEIHEYDVLQSRPLHEYHVGLGAFMRQQTGASTLTELDSVLRRQLGLSNPLSSGLSIQLRMLQQLVLTSLDEESCVEVAAATRSAMSPAIQEVMKSQDWQAEHARVTALLSASCFALGTLEDASPLEIVKASLDLVVTCREGFIRHALATLAAATADDYMVKKRRTSGALIKAFSTTHPGLRLNENLARHFRHAGAHADFDIVDGQIVLRDGRVPVKISEAEFLDGVLAYLETAIGMLLGLLRALDDFGLPLENLAYLAKRDVVIALNVLLGACGFSDPEVVLNDDALTITATGATESFLAIAAGAAGIVPCSVRKVDARLQHDGQWVECTADLEVFRIYGGGTPDESHVDTIMGVAHRVAATKIGGDSPWSADTWAGAAYQVSKRQEAESLAQHIRRVRTFRGLAEQAGAAEVAATLGEILGMLRRQDYATTAPTALPTAFRKPPRPTIS